jgi:hypothetical protein
MKSSGSFYINNIRDVPEGKESDRKLESPIQAGCRDQTIYSDRPIARDSRIDYSL